MWSDWLVFCGYGFSVSALWCPLAIPTVLLGFLLPWIWALSSQLLQESTATASYLGQRVSPHSHPSWLWMWSSSSRPSSANTAATHWNLKAIYQIRKTLQDWGSFTRPLSHNIHFWDRRAWSKSSPLIKQLAWILVCWSIIRPRFEKWKINKQTKKEKQQQQQKKKNKVSFRQNQFL